MNEILIFGRNCFAKSYYEGSTTEVISLIIQIASSLKKASKMTVYNKKKVTQ